MTNDMTWSVEKIKRAIAEEVVSMEVAYLEIIGKDDLANFPST